MKSAYLFTMLLILIYPAFGEDDEFSDFLMDDLDEEQVQDISDPLEPMNKIFFAINQYGFDYIIKPTAIVYNLIMPKIFQRGIDNAIYNFHSPIPIANSVFQGNIDDAGKESSRLIINSTIGLAGFIDVADPILGFKRTNRDTEQTLGKAGFGWGIYGYPPLYGPGTIREVFGVSADTFFKPTTYIFWSAGIVSLYYTLGIYTVQNFNFISMNLELYDNVYRDSFDPYSYVKSAYLQNNLKKMDR
jgi:phospholipid-binding lipoprotein MlaA